MKFTVGDTVKITGRRANHYFEIGELCVITDRALGGKMACATRPGTRITYLISDEDAELVSETVRDGTPHLTTRSFTSDARMKEILNNALDYVGRLGRDDRSYDMHETLSEEFGMTDEEIRTAGFTFVPDKEEE